MKNHFAPLWSALVVLALSPLAWGGAWTTDVQAARTAAAEGNKDLFYFFTGSDWCGWCKKLVGESLSKQEFLDQAPRDFVLVELDFPRRTSLDEATRKQNRGLADQWQIRGFPTVVLADASGLPYAATGYQPGGPVEYLKHLGELRKIKTERDALMRQADAAQGVESAKLLDRAVTLVSEARAPLAPYAPVLQRIIELDPDNAAGLREKYLLQVRTTEVSAAMNREDYEAARKLVDQTVADLKLQGDPLQRMLLVRAMATLQLKDTPGAAQGMREALAASPESKLADQIRHALDELAQQKQP